jgi:hypothetical protein
LTAVPEARRGEALCPELLLLPHRSSRQREREPKKEVAYVCHLRIEKTAGCSSSVRTCMLS